MKKRAYLLTAGLLTLCLSLAGCGSKRESGNDAGDRVLTERAEETKEADSEADADAERDESELEEVGWNFSQYETSHELIGVEIKDNFIYHCYSGGFAGVESNGKITREDLGIAKSIEHNGEIYRVVAIEEIKAEDFDLETLEVPEHIRSICGHAFEKLAVKRIVIPDSVKYMAGGAFYECTDLESVVFPEDINVEGDWFSTFKGCEKLKSAVIPEGAVHLRGTFEGCASLTEIIIPSSVKIIGDRAFKDCINLSEVSFAEGCQVEELEACFTGCESLKHFEIPESVTRIGQETFDGSGLEELWIPDTVTSCFETFILPCARVVKASNSFNMPRIYGSNLELVICSDQTYYMDEERIRPSKDDDSVSFKNEVTVQVPADIVEETRERMPGFNVIAKEDVYVGNGN